jgi:glutaminyl-peptide cyclotransferase
MRLVLGLLLAATAAPAATPRAAPVQSYRVVRVYPHDPSAFTQGLIYLDGKLFESTGLHGRSEIREVNLEDGKVLRSTKIADRYFGEGLVDWGSELISITWRSGIGFRWNRADFKPIGEFRYSGEGWGLTRNAREIVMSDGTPILRFLDPATLEVRRQVKVTDAGTSIALLNELEWVKGEIYANVWTTSLIARIDPDSGRVKGWIDLAGLAAANGFGNSDNVLNGIAYDAARDRLFVTGKNWRRLYEIELAANRRRR